MAFDRQLALNEASSAPPLSRREEEAAFAG
jgi:hypothetical protein